MRFLTTVAQLGCVAWLGIAACRCLNGATPPPFDPAEFELDPQVTLTRWAAEPDVVDPVSMCFDESGRAYVAECRDYPYGAGPNGEVNSTIRLLEDLNGDGVPERSTVFADKLSFATSVTPWRGGVLVAAAPDIVFLKDTDGDGRADIRQVVLTGFHRGVSDSLVNGLRFHLDGRIHGANGGNNGVISSPRWRGENQERGPVDLRGHDFAFEPDTGALELTTRSAGGFGLVFDDLGRAFTTYNINHIQYCFLPRRYAENHPAIPAEGLTASISDHDEMSRIFPISEARTRPNHPEQAGYFSAAGGMGYIGSVKWPATLYGSVLVCDVVGNLVHRDMIRETRGGFIAARGTNELDREFLASRDPDFRPVGLECGPDGALYMLAMQRTVIEHPDYIPATSPTRQNLRAGADRGRIYRLAPPSGFPPVKVDLGQAKSADLVPLLAHEDQWWRYTAQRLLLERNATEVEGAVRLVARDTKHPLGRLHALWTLRRLGALKTGDLQFALQDGHAGVRENALLLAEPVIEATPSLVPMVLALMDDRMPRVRYQAILTAGASMGERAISRFGQLLRHLGGEPLIRQAVLASIVPSDLGTILQNLMRDASSAMVQSGAILPVYRDVTDLIGARAEARPGDFEGAIKRLEMGLSEVVRTAILSGLISGLERSGNKPKLSPSAVAAVTTLANRAPESRLILIWRLIRLCGLPDPPNLLVALPAAIAGATNSTVAWPARLTHVELAAFDPGAGGGAALLQCLTGTAPPEIQSAALAGLRRRADPTLGAELVARWRFLSPVVRDPALQLLLSRRNWHADLVDAWESGRLTVGEFNLDLEQRRRLLNGSSPELRERVKKFIGDGEYANRAAIVGEWLAKLPQLGNADAGRKIFEANCAMCHRARGVGRNVGPQLSVAHRSVEDLLANILDPNMAVNPRYLAYFAETRDGESHTGLLLSQDTARVNLVQAEEITVSLPRQNLLNLENTGRSLMPEGLEQGRTPQDLRDLIAFLQARR